MPGRTTRAAWDSYINPMNKALRCIAKQKGFVVKELAEGLETDKTYVVTLNNMQSVSLPLKSPNSPETPTAINLVAGQNIEIYERESDTPSERYGVKTISYVYGFTTVNDVELLTFHWRREQGIDISPRGHLHVGPALVANQTVVRPKTFHKAHIPVGRVSFGAVVRFAIEELGVKPQVQNWRSVLSSSEAAFHEDKTID